MLLDTSAWIEYFKGSLKGEKVASLLQGERAIFTCPLTLAEIAVWCQRNGHDPSPFVQKIKSLSALLDLSEEILIMSGNVYSVERRKSGKLGLIDAIIYTTARIHSLELVTADQDFRHLDGVRLL